MSPETLPNDLSTDAHAAHPASPAHTEHAAGRDCPHCGCDKIQHWGAAHGLPRYRCGACKRTFNPLTGTSLARLRSKEKWFLFLRTVAQQKSIRKSAEICGVDNTTVLRWRRRFQECTPAEKRSIMLALAECCPSLLILQQGRDAMPEWVTDLLPTLLSWLS